MVINRNGTEFIRLKASDFTIRMNYALISTNTYVDNYRPTAFGVDTFFYGNNSADNAYIEYFRFNHTDQRCDFNVPIDNTGLLIKGNIDDTTPSDERLKTNIKDVESNFTECVKNVKVKTFEYTDEKFKDNHKYGFIAQELQKHLPIEFKTIVNKTKTKKDEEQFLSINYMRLSVVLWGCCQEQQSKIEHLESRLFELEDIVKELKDNKKPKAKAKAKSKS